MVETINKVAKAEHELIQRLGRQPTIEEITDELGGSSKGFTTRKVVGIKKINIDPISLDKSIVNDEDSQIADFVKQDDVATPNAELPICPSGRPTYSPEACSWE